MPKSPPFFPSRPYFSRPLPPSSSMWYNRKMIFDFTPIRPREKRIPTGYLIKISLLRLRFEPETASLHLSGCQAIIAILLPVQSYFSAPLTVFLRLISISAVLKFTGETWHPHFSGWHRTTQQGRSAPEHRPARSTRCGALPPPSAPLSTPF